MSYSVHEIFYSLQGEGARTGRPSVFCRFAGCNLWTGREADRSTAICRFCDTEFVGVHGRGGGRFNNADSLADALRGYWSDSAATGIRAAVPYVVFTGGEPLLQLDTSLIDAVHKRGFEIAVETNGTVQAPEGIDWICVSPKANAAFLQRSGNELKLVYPQPELDPAQLEGLAFSNFFLQPMDGPNRAEYTRLSIDYCLQHPRWELSLQTHKMQGLR